jgi:hypothetical protein
MAARGFLFVAVHHRQWQNPNSTQESADPMDQPPKAQSPMIAQAHVLDGNKPNLERAAPSL